MYFLYRGQPDKIHNAYKPEAYTGQGVGLILNTRNANKTVKMSSFKSSKNIKTKRVDQTE